MKNKIFFPMIGFLLLLVNMVMATPVIQNVSIDPSYLWLGEEATVSLDCFDNSNNTIDYVYADITGPGIILPRMFFVPSGGDYVLLVDEIYLDRTGIFDTTLYCENNNSEISSDSTGFTVSELTGYINIIDPNPAYIGEIVEIDFIVKKDGLDLSSGVTFDVKFNGITKALKVSPAYDTSKGWVLKLDSPTVVDNYDIDVTAFYDRAEVVDSSSLEVNNYVQFEIVSINKNWFDINDELIVTLRALEGGSVITLDENNIEIDITGSVAEIKSITFHDNVFDVKIVAPSVSSGKHNLEAKLDHNSYTYSDTIEVSYVVSIEGEIVGYDDKGLSVNIKFIKDDAVKLSLITDAFGKYSTSLPPDTYDIEIIFPQSKLYIYSAIVNSFYDPIKYSYSDSITVPGIITAGLHDFGISLTYSSVDIEMEYKENNVDDETELVFFKCSNWNSGKKICNGEWDEVFGEVDVNRNMVEIESSGLSAFVIGTRDELDIDFNLDKIVYNLEELITVTGLVKDSLRKTVNNAFIELSVEGTDIKSETNADKNGIFSIIFPVPEMEGNYTLSLNAEKYPYMDFEEETSFIISKSKSVYINFPDTIKIERGKNYTQRFSLINTGQDTIELSLSLTGIPEEYYKLSSIKKTLELDEESSFYIDFFVPEHAETEIKSVTLQVSGNDFSEDKVFGLNVVESEQVETEIPTGFATGFEFPTFNLEVVYVVLIGAIFIVFILILKKKMPVNTKRNGITTFLHNVKNQLERTAISVDKFIENINYDDLILSEFPKALEKINKDDDYGKNN
jgi:hypothetical protein